MAGFNSHEESRRLLLSPPEQCARDDLQRPDSSWRQGHCSAARPSIHHPPLSPPASPAFNSNIHDSECWGPYEQRDPLLFPIHDDRAARLPLQPLFGPISALGPEATRRVVQEHVAATAEIFSKASPPDPEEYELALYFKSAVMKKFMENPRGWLTRERKLLAADRMSMASRKSNMTLPPILPATKASSTARAAAARNIPNRLQKPRDAVPTPPPRPATARPIRSGVRNHGQVPLHSYTVPQPRVRNIFSTREDKNFEALRDICPPLESLPFKPNSLKVDWKGNALDLSKDPYANLLHPDELSLASCLRLDCATYLTSKRRIFLRRLECAKLGKEFRKTDAQQACKIDVNKASKLWTAYEKVGWLAKSWVEPYIE